MGFPRYYFATPPEGPLPLTADIARRVRFEEVDALNMVWHGRYPSYFEDGRIAFGEKHGLSYQLFKAHGVMAPIVQMHVDYHGPLRFNDTVRIEATLYWNDALRLDFDYKIIDSRQQLVTSGYTVQLLTDLHGDLLLIPPEWFQEFKNKWCQGHLG
ncbi:MAG: acyl-CoA thioesterase [Desulfobulbaceae bacterium]|nr:acyl-CoA thioesterase [Desulfobulbaceae bacterium]HIJ78980.1 acyl-CoA thioesterase [Deltaproteobacteria bacterium]